MSQPPPNLPARYPPLEFQEVPVRPLEQVRPRLTQLSHSLRKFDDTLRTSQSLPSWTTVQNQFNVILSQLTSFAKTLDANRGALGAADVYPNYDFDTSQHEGLLTTLLRKKHLPEVDEWINSADIVDDRIIDKDEEITRACLEVVQELLQDHVFGGYITKEEGEKGITSEDIFGKKDANVEKSETTSESDMYRFIYQGLDSKVGH